VHKNLQAGIRLEWPGDNTIGICNNQYPNWVKGVIKLEVREIVVKLGIFLFEQQLIFV